MEPVKRGRKPIYTTDEERKAAIKRYRKAAREKSRNVTLSAELADKLGLLCDSLVPLFGFRPSYSQALLYVLAYFERQKEQTPLE